MLPACTAVVFSWRVERWLGCRCPRDTGALLLFRKVVAEQPRAILLEGPPCQADDATMDAWLQAYRAALDSADPKDGEPEGTPPCCCILPINHPP